MEHILSFFRFLKEKRGKNIPFVYRLLHEADTLTKDELIVRGDLDLSGMHIQTLPEGLLIVGDLDLKDAVILGNLPPMTVRGSLELQGSNIMTLPEGLKVGKFLDIADTPLADTIPQRIEGIREFLHSYFEERGVHVSGEIYTY